MRVGVMTFWQSQDNYGQLLQCYALQKYLRDLGHDAFLIRYRMRGETSVGFRRKLLKYGLHPWRVLDGIRRVLTRRRTSRMAVEHPRGFDAFRKQHLRFSEFEYRTIAELRANPPAADAYIVGSDQVWRMGANFHPDDELAMLLAFGPKAVKRISYAASFGRTMLPPLECTRFAPLLKEFEAVSVREDSGVRICAAMERGDAITVCDPTLLLSEREYRMIAESHLPTRKYVFCYMLTNDCSFKYPKLRAWAESHGLVIVYVKGNLLLRSTFADDEAECANPTIQQWMGLIDGAECVITNSFHCSVFAAHFGKRLGLVPLEGRCGGMNSRFDALDKLLVNPISRIEDNEFGLLSDMRTLRFKEDVGSSGVDFLAHCVGRAG